MPSGLEHSGGGGFWIICTIGWAVYSLSTGALNGQDSASRVAFFLVCGIFLSLAAAWMLGVCLRLAQTQQAAQGGGWPVGDDSNGSANQPSNGRPWELLSNQFN
jgi:hypothetical protein